MHFHMHVALPGHVGSTHLTSELTIPSNCSSPTFQNPTVCDPSPVPVARLTREYPRIPLNYVIVYMQDRPSESYLAKNVNPAGVPGELRGYPWLTHIGEESSGSAILAHPLRRQTPGETI
eukprot:scpid106961/ scgid17857/ 